MGRALSLILTRNVAELTIQIIEFIPESGVVRCQNMT